jgi:hypothetical protein
MSTRTSKSAIRTRRTPKDIARYELVLYACGYRQNGCLRLLTATTNPPCPTASDSAVPSLDFTSGRTRTFTLER